MKELYKQNPSRRNKMKRSNRKRKQSLSAVVILLLVLGIMGLMVWKMIPKKTPKSEFKAQDLGIGFGKRAAVSKPRPHKQYKSGLTTTNTQGNSYPSYSKSAANNQRLSAPINKEPETDTKIKPGRNHNRSAAIVFSSKSPKKKDMTGK